MKNGLDRGVEAKTFIALLVELEYDASQSSSIFEGRITMATKKAAPKKAAKKAPAKKAPAKKAAKKK
jgi:hypothetical protein